MIGEYLKFGSVLGYEPRTIKRIDISFEDAIDEYDHLIRDQIEKMDQFNPTYTLSGGLDSSLIFSYLDEPNAICVHALGNTDREYASRLYPNIKIIDEYNNFDIERALIEIQKIWNTPHCMLGDLFDWFVYKQGAQMVTGDEISHFNISEELIRNPNIFFDWISVFSDEEIISIGHTPPRIEVKNVNYLIDYIHNWHTQISRRLFFKYSNVTSPFMKIRSFYQRLPIEYLNGKRIIRELVKRKLPSYILDRPKKSTVGPSKGWYDLNKHQYDELILKYLKEKSRKIFQVIPYEFVQANLSDYRKMWTLLNLSIWLN